MLKVTFIYLPLTWLAIIFGSIPLGLTNWRPLGLLLLALVPVWTFLLGSVMMSAGLRLFVGAAIEGQIISNCRFIWLLCGDREISDILETRFKNRVKEKRGDLVG